MNNLYFDEENRSSDEQLDPFQQLLIRYIHRIAECFPLENNLQRGVDDLEKLVRNNKKSTEG